MKDREDLIRQGAQAMVDWGVMLAQDYFESILEDVFPVEMPNKDFWQTAWEAHHLAQSASIPAENSIAKQLVEELLEMDRIGAIELANWATARSFIEETLDEDLEEVQKND